MFTGIIEATGVIEAAEQRAENLRLSITSRIFAMNDVKLGDSIAVNGVCLTVVGLNGSGFSADVSPETLNCTTGLKLGASVNLEKALRFGDRVGGHLVSGHVDGVGRVTALDNLGAHWRVAFSAPRELARYIARKGSIAVNGVSLTVNHVDNERFEVNLIPHTWSVTTLELLQVGSEVNLEIDTLARYVERMLSETAT
ncbi:MAG: riboflavin synthase [Betaproteobacteria bacterium]|nr:riboflavin synthase [Betaproteobacteria bacterium]